MVIIFYFSSVVIWTEWSPRLRPFKPQHNQGNQHPPRELVGMGPEETKRTEPYNILCREHLHPPRELSQTLAHGILHTPRITRTRLFTTFFTPITYYLLCFTFCCPIDVCAGYPKTTPLCTLIPSRVNDHKRDSSWSNPLMG